MIKYLEGIILLNVEDTLTGADVRIHCAEFVLQHAENTPYRVIPVEKRTVKLF